MDPRFLHVNSKGSDQIGRMHMPFCWFCYGAAQISLVVSQVLIQLRKDGFV